MMYNSTVMTRGNSKNQTGNATIYVLIVVALFAALAIIVSRQNSSGEAQPLSTEKASIIADQIIAYPYQVKQSIDMMMMNQTESSSLDFTLPTSVDFNTAPTITKVFHPDGGGLTLAQIPQEAVNQTSTNPVAGWYLGMFNNVEWTESQANDVMLVAWQLSQQICAMIDQKLTGSSTIPTVNDTIPNLFINKEYPPGNAVHSGTNALDFSSANCAGCYGKPQLCVADTGSRYGFYSLILGQ